jgi:hypothetical protein
MHTSQSIQCFLAGKRLTRPVKTNNPDALTLPLGIVQLFQDFPWWQRFTNAAWDIVIHTVIYPGAVMTPDIAACGHRKWIPLKPAFNGRVKTGMLV